MVFSQSIAVSSHGSISASGSATTCAAAYAMRLKRCVSAFEGNTIGSTVLYGSSLRCFVGSAIVATLGSSNSYFGHIEPAPLRPALQPELGELHALDPF